MQLIIFKIDLITTFTISAVFTFTIVIFKSAAQVFLTQGAFFDIFDNGKLNMMSGSTLVD